MAYGNPRSLFPDNTAQQGGATAGNAAVFRRKRKPTHAATDDLAKKDSGFKAIGELFSNYQLDEKNGYVSREFQDYGYRLAVELDDLRHKSLYIKLAKELPRGILEKARSFVSDANARSKAKLFMWKVKILSSTPKGTSTTKAPSTTKAAGENTSSP